MNWKVQYLMGECDTLGKEMTQLTEDKFVVRTGSVNTQTGKLVVAGYYDTNNNNKYDKTDKDEILIYDLKTLKLASRI
ncbi:hypothetical protein DW785_21455 [Bacteroides xylanisolvens]|jgi:hypothetical protein|uniref:Uncharacterized protein n=1 Tax=Bacteroides xylanisolvens TaxID=371601 RepID=A0AAW4T3A9_9BACE|nr:hypothetical protein [Bacteroides xylanisolvens]MCA4535214.1 hypothetical protein [Bacteroides xylanisolvens]MCA4553276.1 hypothetical protein [Bacteroides xylanisolvens]MCA4566940.1 hypothetical protein [Bacteroides xylanisolvens]MCA4571823.1 hypothetical protein [Bacteroides xylanisolvens]MCA4602326.1 hypothetical protein [Bacteroides xylanisolvens]